MYCIDTDHFWIVHWNEGVEVGYVEEDDEEREESAGKTDEQNQAKFGKVWQGRETQLCRSWRDQAGQTRHWSHLKYVAMNLSIF